VAAPIEQIVDPLIGRRGAGGFFPMLAAELVDDLAFEINR
jgi:hypothetical protein